MGDALWMQDQHRVCQIDPTQKGLAKTISNPLLNSLRQFRNIFHTVGQILVLLLPQVPTSGESRINQSLILGVVCASAMETAGQDHKAITWLQFGVERLRLFCRAFLVVPEMRSWNVPRGTVRTRSLLSSHEKSDSCVATKMVFSNARVVNMVDRIISM